MLPAMMVMFLATKKFLSWSTVARFCDQEIFQIFSPRTLKSTLHIIYHFSFITGYRQGVMRVCVSVCGGWGWWWGRGWEWGGGVPVCLHFINHVCKTTSRMKSWTIMKTNNWIFVNAFDNFVAKVRKILFGYFPHS